MKNILVPGSHRQTGVTMIEVLVVVIIIAVGLLGIVALQTSGVKQAGYSNLQTQAVFLVQDLADKIRANRENVINKATGAVILGNYAKAPGSTFPTSATAACYTATGCTPAQMATSNMVAWAALIQSALPVDSDILKDNTYVCLDSNAGDATVCDGLGSTLVIQIAWTDSSQQGNAVRTHQLVFEP